MDTPLILCLLDSGEILLFRNLESLESAIEAVDVLNGEYRAYDASGRVLDLSVDKFGAPRALLSTLSGEAQLKSWIVDNYATNPAIAEGSTLREMLEVLQRIYRYGNEEG